MKQDPQGSVDEGQVLKRGTSPEFSERVTEVMAG
jgi:hypothetical protein